MSSFRLMIINFLQFIHFNQSFFRCHSKKVKPLSPPIPAPRQYRPALSESTTSEEEDEEKEIYEDEEYVEDDDCYYSDRSPYRDDLPYQNNEEYLDLVQELEETLQNRSKNRVHRAMREFEHRSRYNKPLEKPIINYDETSESEEPIIQKIYYLTDKKKQSTYPPYRKPSNEETCRRPRRKSKSPRGHSKSPPHLRRDTKRNKIHWQMDLKTGEWYRMEANRRRRKSRSPSPLKSYKAYDCSCGNHKYK